MRNVEPAVARVVPVVFRTAVAVDVIAEKIAGKRHLTISAYAETSAGYMLLDAV